MLIGLVRLLPLVLLCGLLTSPNVQVAQAQEVRRTPDQESAAAAWRAKVIARLNEVRRPAPIHAVGTPIVRFSIGRNGRLTGFAIVRSSGNGILDAQAERNIRSAEPFPPPPASILRGGAVHLVLPLRFYYRTRTF